MTYKWTRYDVEAVSLRGGTSLTNRDDGEYVFAEDAINREAVNAAEIATLKVQLKEAKERGDREYAIAEMRRKKLDEVYKIVSGG